MHKAIVRMPRLNANEDEAKLASIHVAEGSAFKQGDLLFSIETTKVAVDVEAPCDGEMVALLSKQGALVGVGSAMCHMHFAERAEAGELDIEWVDDFAQTAAASADGTPKISAKARLRAQALGVDLAQVPMTDGVIRVQDVEEYHARHGGTEAPAQAPAILSRYGPADAVIMGGGGHARAILDTAQGLGYRIIGATDAKLAIGSAVADGVAILGREDLLEELFARGVRTAFVGVGGATSNAARAAVYQRLVAIGFSLPPLIARTAYLGLGSSVGDATYLFPGANVGPAVSIGSNCIINQNAVIAHDSRIGDHVHLTPNAVIAGHCAVGSGSTIGMCATVLNSVSVGENCLVHNNVAVMRDLPDGTVLSAKG